MCKYTFITMMEIFNKTENSSVIIMYKIILFYPFNLFSVIISYKKLFNQKLKLTKMKSIILEVK